MPRFTFSKKFGDTPSAQDYNDIKDDFLDFINTTKLDRDNLQDESIRFRHLRKAPVLLLWKDCGNEIWSADNDILRGLGRAVALPVLTTTWGAFETEWDLYKNTNLDASNTLQLEYSVDEDSPNVNLVEFCFYYYPYSISSNSQVAPAYFKDGEWVPIVEHRRYAGMAVGHYAPGDTVPYDVGQHVYPGGVGSRPLVKPHPYIMSMNFGEAAPHPTSVAISTGVGDYDRLGTFAYGGPIVCSVLFKREDLDGVTKFGMMVKHDLSQDEAGDKTSYSSGAVYNYEFYSVCSVFDRLFMWLVARDN